MRLGLVSAIVGIGLLGACDSVVAPPLMTVMQSCEANKKFSDFVSCVKTNYTRSPNDPGVLSFYAQLNSVVEDYDLGLISNNKARAQTYQLYDATVGAGNRARQNRPVTNVTVQNRVGYGW
jgi:hypothetical protein